MRLRRVPTWIATTAALFLMLGGSAAHAEGLNNLMAGLNGLVTFPVDPGYYATNPPEDVEGIWGSPVTSSLLGFMTGVVMMPYRAAMGALDVVLFPFWVFPTLSPEAHFDLFPNYDIEYE